jgi:hypothetical protein
MYSEAELESAVSAGTLSRESADALRAHVSDLRDAPSADEEQFRLITSFNDIFVAMAGVLVLIGVGWIGGSVAPFVGAAAVAAASWGLAEFFTRKRRMAFPSILFFLTFVIGIYYAVIGAFGPMFRFQTAMQLDGQSFENALSNYAWHSAIASFVVIGAAWAHWKRFMVPIAFATIVGAIAYTLYGVINAALMPSIAKPSDLRGFVHTYQLMMWVVLIIGLVVFAYAMHWDMQDRARQSRKADVAFWLHLVASPLVVHPVFVLVGMNMLSAFSPMGSDFAKLSTSGTFIATTAIIIYALLAVVALIVDRRAILVSALVYVLTAAIYLARQAGSTEIGFAVAIIVIGSSLLMLSAFWQAMRRALMPLVPERIRDRMPLIS